MALNVKRAAKIRGMKMKDLAEKIGITAVGLSRILYNDGGPSYKSLKKIADTLDCQVDDLFDGIPEEGGQSLFPAGSFTCPYCGKSLRLMAVDDDDEDEED